MNKSISKEELQKLPIKAFEGKVIVVNSRDDMKKAISYLQKQKILGFDTETRPTFKKGALNKVALLQLSTETTAILFRLNKIGLPLELTSILSNKNIIKAGVAIDDDLKSLKKLTKFTPNGFIEIQQKVKEFDIENFGLKKLSGLLLNFNISKTQQTSNWELDPLTPAQIKYAATDAWVSLKIYKALINIEKQNNTETE
jgi:ribonuclease D